MENSAKPIHPINDYNTHPGSYGLTKREYFAAMAMQGLLAKIKFDATPKSMTDNVSKRVEEFFRSISADSIKHADELLKQLEKPTK